MNRRAVSWLSVAVAIVTAALAIGLAFYFDEPARQFFSSHRSRTLYQVMRYVGRLGDWPEHFALGLLLAALAWWRGRKEWVRIFLAMLIAFAIAGLAGRVIKIATGRARPSVKTEEVWNGPRLGSKYHAFPSGHVAASSAFFGVLVFNRRRLGLACMIIPVVIGFSRMYVAAHYLSDVVCAFVLGLTCAALVSSWLLRTSDLRPLTSDL